MLGNFKIIYWSICRNDHKRILVHSPLPKDLGAYSSTSFQCTVEITFRFQKGIFKTFTTTRTFWDETEKHWKQNCDFRLQLQWSLWRFSKLLPLREPFWDETEETSKAKMWKNALNDNEIITIFTVNDISKRSKF